MAEFLLAKNLEISLSQISTSPPTLSVSVKNTHPSKHITILTWESPLDPIVLPLGLVSVTPAGATAPINMDTIKVSRQMPPGADQLVTLKPGENATNDVMLRDPVVPKETWDKGSARVAMRGRWAAVWPGVTKDDLLGNKQKLGALGAGDGVLTGDWDAPLIDISA